MKNLMKASFLIFLTLAFVGCSDDDDNGNQTQNDVTISQYVAANPDYSSLAAALDVAGLTATLDGTTDYTVFAPNNAAFSTFLNENGFASLSDVPVDVLTQVLLNHVIGGTNLAADLSTGYINSLATFGTTDNALNMYVNVESGVVLNGVSTVTAADIAASNGVVHAVDAVIGLPTVVTFATADATFQTLVAALTRDDQPDFVSILSASNGTAPAPFTVFAPTNDAFSDLLTELTASSLDDIDGPTLTAALNTHVLAGANVLQADLTDGVINTLGDDLTVDATNGTLTDPNGRVSTIVVFDVQAANGVVHVINKVLLPQL